MDGGRGLDPINNPLAAKRLLMYPEQGVNHVTGIHPFLSVVSKLREKLAASPGEKTVVSKEEESIPLEYTLFLTPRRLRTR